MFRKFRITMLLLVLFVVGMDSLLTRLRSTDWHRPLVVVIYPINGDGSKRSTNYIQQLTQSYFNSIEYFFRREAQRFGQAIKAPVEIKLAPPIDTVPPEPPKNGNVLEIMLWSLKMRYWAYQADSYDGPLTDIQMFVLYFDPQANEVLEHSVGLEKGMLGRVNAYASRKLSEKNNVIIAHELLHTVGATDKYNLISDQPLYPEGYAEPDRQPLFPQRKAELMGGRIPVSETEAKIPSNLDKVVIGDKTATEIKWLN